MNIASKKINFRQRAFLTFVALLGLQAQGKMDLEPFDAISVTGNIDVILEEGQM